MAGLDSAVGVVADEISCHSYEYELYGKEDALSVFLKHPLIRKYHVCLSYNSVYYYQVVIVAFVMLLGELNWEFNCRYHFRGPKRRDDDVDYAFYSRRMSTVY